MESERKTSQIVSGGGGGDEEPDEGIDQLQLVGQHQQLPLRLLHPTVPHNVPRLV